MRDVRIDNFLEHRRHRPYDSSAPEDGPTAARCIAVEEELRKGKGSLVCEEIIELLKRDKQSTPWKIARHFDGNIQRIGPFIESMRAQGVIKVWVTSSLKGHPMTIVELKK